MAEHEDVIKITTRVIVPEPGPYSRMCMINDFRAAMLLKGEQPEPWIKAARERTEGGAWSEFEQALIDEAEPHRIARCERLGVDPGPRPANIWERIES